VKNIESVSFDVRKTIVRLSNCIQILNQLGLPIYDTSIMQIYDVSMDYEVNELIEPTVIDNLAKHFQQPKEMISRQGGEEYEDERDEQGELIERKNNDIDTHLNDMREE
jgi:hypothetical protein